MSATDSCVQYVKFTLLLSTEILQPNIKKTSLKQNNETNPELFRLGTFLKIMYLKLMNWFFCHADIFFKLGSLGFLQNRICRIKLILLLKSACIQ
jgi:hypothetical protein